jgi:hyperosmotically inducible protein
MKIILSRKAIVMATAALIGMGTLSTSVTSFAQESTFAKKSAAIKADFKLEHTVQKRFDKEKHFDSSDVRVVARKGVITLDGTMADDKQIERATEISTATPGVKSVTNSLTLKEAGH